MNLLYHTNKKLPYKQICAAILIVFCTIFYVANTAHAQVNNDIEQGLRDKYEALCDAFNDLSDKDKKGVKPKCQSYAKKVDQDKSAKKICDKLGKGKLKDECKAYNDYQPGSGRAPQSGGEIAKQVNDPALDCVANNNKCDLVKKYINPFIAFLSALVGVAVTIGLITGGIRYASAGDDPQKVNEAKKFISTSLIALFAFFILYAALKWLTPSLT